MNAFLNRNLLTQTGSDSGALNVHGTVMHHFSESGTYLGTLLRGEEIVGQFTLVVEGKNPAMQVDIDLNSLDRPATLRQGGELKDTFSLSPEGYAVFHVSTGKGGYAVVVTGLQEGRKITVFDSRALNEGDYFVANLLRPGTYALANTCNKSRGTIVIDYPEIGRVLRQPLEPVSIIATAKAFEPGHVQLKPTQGLVFSFKTISRIEIKLEKPDDGPEKARRPRLLRRRRLAP